jgi:hypothetical protein
MAALTTEERLKAVHEEALREFDRVQSALRDERMQCLQDRRFYSIAGAQWEGQLGEQFENRPRLEFNKTHLAVIRIINEYRNNRVTVDFTPKDGTSRADLADTCDGLYRADELDSGAEEAYDNCFEEGVGGGFGAARVRADYEDEYDEDNDQQRIRIEPIFDADTSVYFDLDAKRQDKADAKRCWVLYSMTKEAFVDEFDHDPVGIEKTTRGGTDGFEWVQNDMVFVAEYYRVEQTTELVHWFRGLVEDEPDMRVRDAELTDEKRHFLESTGFREVRQKRVKVRKVRKYIMSGDRIESDEGYIAGKCIPVVPFYGKRWFVDNIERCMGHVRLAKDAQRLQNSLLTWLTEIAAKFNTEKLILTPEQVGPYAQMWADDNTENFPFLYVQSMKDAQGNVLAPTQPPKTIAPSVPPAMAALVEIATQALNDLLGNQQAGEEMQPNISGKTVELIQQRLDMQVFIYMSNFAKFVKRVGEVWLSMAKEVYVEDGRQMKTITPDGEPGTVTLHAPTLDEKTGEHYAGNNMDEATFDVRADVGPSSSSKRQATVRALTSLASISADPAQQSVLLSAAIMNMEGEGLQDVRNYFRKQLVMQGVVKPTDEEAQEMEQAKANQQPDPQTQLAMAAANQANAQAQTEQAKSVDTLAAAGLKKAQTALAAAQTVKTIAETHGEHVDQRVSLSDAIGRAANPPAGPGTR